MEKKSNAQEGILKQIEEQMKKIQYGSVTAVIHGGKVVQLDTNEKIRFAK